MDAVVAGRAILPTESEAMMTRAIKAVTLTDTQLRMLDIGAPVIVACETLTGETVAVRLQTQMLAEHDASIGEAALGSTTAGAQSGGWLSHGAYVAVMPAGVDYGS
jgi:hypothetical protein